MSTGLVSGLDVALHFVKEDGSTVLKTDDVVYATGELMRINTTHSHFEIPSEHLAAVKQKYDAALRAGQASTKGSYLTDLYHVLTTVTCQCPLCPADITAAMATAAIKTRLALRDFARVFWKARSGSDETSTRVKLGLLVKDMLLSFRGYTKGLRNNTTAEGAAMKEASAVVRAIVSEGVSCYGLYVYNPNWHTRPCRKC